MDGLAGFSAACALFIAMASVVVYASVAVPMSGLSMVCGVFVIYVENCMEKKEVFL